jgi:hypothetical protein
MSLAGRVFIFIFAAVACVAFVGMVAYMNSHNNAVDTTINTTTEAYYSMQASANQSMNQTLLYGDVFILSNPPVVMLIAICTMVCAVFIFATVSKR